MGSIRFGLSATLSGKYGLQGLDSLNGLLLWSEYQNILGGIFVKDLGKKLPVELIYFDDQSEPEKTAEITEKLITDEKVDFLLGPYSSSLCLESAKIARKLGRVLWNYGGSADEIFSPEFENTVSSITPASRYFHSFLVLLKEKKIDEKAAVVYASDSNFSQNVALGAMKYAEELGIEIKNYTYKSGSNSFAEIVQKLKQSNISTLMGVGRFEDDLLFAEYLNGFTACLVGAGIGEFQKKLGNKSEGFCSVTQWEPEIETRPDFCIESKVFTKIYKERFGKVPDYTAAQSFNMGIILSHFIEQAGKLDDGEIKERTLSSKFSTFYGNFEIDRHSNTQTGHKTIVTQWKAGKREIIYPEAYSTSEFLLSR